MWDRDGQTRDPSRPNQSPTDHWDNESRAPVYGSDFADRQTFEDPWASGKQLLRPIISSLTTNTVSAVFNTISPNTPSVVTLGYPNPLNNNSTEIIPSSSPSEWKESGDAIWCHLNPTPFQMALDDGTFLAQPQYPQLFQRYIIDMLNLRMRLTNTSADADGSALTTGLWCEFITTDWNPTTLCWNNRPLSLDTATTDAAGAAKYTIVPGLSNGTGSNTPRTPIHAIIGTLSPNQSLTTQADPVPLDAAETLRLTLTPFQMGDLNIRNFPIGTPTTTTFRMRGTPYDYVNVAVDMTLHQVLWNSQYNVAHNFVGAKVKLTAYDNSFADEFSVVSDYAVDGTFTISPPFNHTPRVGVSMGTPDFGATDILVVHFPYYGIAIHSYCKAFPKDGGSPESFSLLVDPIKSISFEQMNFNSQTGFPA